MANQPEKKFTVGAVSAAVWRTGRQDDQGRPIYSVQLDRTYKDREGAWQSSRYLPVWDVPKAILALQKAYEYLSLREVEGESEGAAPPEDGR